MIFRRRNERRYTNLAVTDQSRDLMRRGWARSRLDMERLSEDKAKRGGIQYNE